jgi:hypothetical protein
MATIQELLADQAKLEELTNEVFAQVDTNVLDKLASQNSELPCARSLRSLGFLSQLEKMSYRS